MVDWSIAKNYSVLSLRKWTCKEQGDWQVSLKKEKKSDAGIWIIWYQEIKKIPEIEIKRRIGTDSKKQTRRELENTQ